MYRQDSDDLRPQPLPGLAGFKKPSLRRQRYESENSREREPQIVANKQDEYDRHVKRDKEQLKEYYETNVRDKNIEDRKMSNIQELNVNQLKNSSYRRMETTTFNEDMSDRRRASGFDSRNYPSTSYNRRLSYDPRAHSSIREERRSSYNPSSHTGTRYQSYDPRYSRDGRSNSPTTGFRGRQSQERAQTQNNNEDFVELRRRPYQSRHPRPEGQRFQDLPNSSRPSRPGPSRQISKKPGSEKKSAEELFNEAQQKKQPLSDIPINLRDKKRLLQNKIHANPEERIVLPSMSFWRKALIFIQNIWGIIEPWSGVLKVIEGTYGSGVGSYFRLLRTLLYINTFVGVMTLIFLILPVATGNQETTSRHFSFSDIFLGNGYLQDTILFYGASTYTQGNVPGGFWKDFSVPQGYIFTTLAGYLVYLLIILVDVVVAYRKSFIDSAEIVGKKYGTTVFTAWEMTIEDKASAQQLKDKICFDLKKLLKLSLSKQRKTEVKVSKGLILLRCLIWCLVLGVIGGICFGIYRLLDSDFSKNNHHLYVVPLLISGIVLLMPWMLTLANKPGKYGARYSLYMRLLQTCLLVLTALMMIRIFWQRNKSIVLGNDVCKETRLGQEMYRLIIFYFLIIVLMNFVFETVWHLLHKFGATFLGSPDFDISRNTTNLIYCQMVTCLGYYNSPMLPLLTTLIFFLTFYIQRFSLSVNCKNSKKTWTTSTTRTIYLIITFFAILLPSAMFVATIVSPTHSACGPFPIDIKPIEASGIKTNDVTNFIFSSAFWGCISVALSVLLFYTWSSATEQKRLGKTLFRELKSDRKEMRHLQKECKKYNVTD